MGPASACRWVDSFFCGISSIRPSIQSSYLGRWRRALRIHQWAKNALVFVPLLASHELMDTEKIKACVIAFLAFGLCASATYVWNDLLDLETDRAHPTKRSRPFASGELSPEAGLVVSTVLMVSGFALALYFLPLKFAAILALYVAITLSYSLYLKRKLMIDVIVLGSLYALRVFGGGVATGLPISPWLLAFSVFFFLSLAFVKRYVDLDHLPRDGTAKIGGRGYIAQDIDLVRVLGPLSGYVAVMVIGLYVNSPQVAGLYSSPEWLWLACLCVLYWISRVWFLAHRGHMPEDPVVFALTDRISQLTGVATIAFVALAAVS